MRLREMWRRIFRTKYSALLEAEVARLRAENRALLNSILGIAGVPPIAVAGDDPALVKDARPGSGAEVAKRNMATSATSVRASTQNLANVAAPTRRRSWHQVYRMLEIDSARKKEVV